MWLPSNQKNKNKILALQVLIAQFVCGAFNQHIAVRLMIRIPSEIEAVREAQTKTNDPRTCRIKPGEGIEESRAWPSLITNTDVPLSNTLNAQRSHLVADRSDWLPYAASRCDYE